MSYLSTAIKKARYLVTRDSDQVLILEKNDGSFLDIVLDSPAARDAAISTAVNALIAGAPGALDTLNELATALADDANFATTVTTSLGNRLLWRGAWTAATDYVRNDLVLFNGGLYVAPSNFTSGASFVKTNWTELTPQSGTYQPVVIVAFPTGVVATDWASISAAQTKAAAIVASGGFPIVKFPSCPYSGSPGSGTLTPYAIGANTIVPIQGVRYEGVRPSIYYFGDTASQEGPGGDFQFIGGTVLMGNGTAQAFAANNAPLSVPDVLFYDEGLNSGGIVNFGLDTFTYGIQIGAQNRLGTANYDIDQIYPRNCSQWGVELVNAAQGTNVGYIQTCLCQNGFHVKADMPSLTYSPGNSSIDHVFVAIPQDGRDNRACRGIFVEVSSTSGTPDMNEWLVGRLQINSFNVPTLSVTATLTSGQSTISVPDASKYRVGYVCQFTTSAPGFSTNRCYVVRAVDTVGNTITLSPSRSQAAIAASGNGTATLTTNGFASLDIGPTPGTTAASNWYVTHFNVHQVDTEGSKVGIYAENVLSSIITQNNVPSGYVGLLARKCGTGVFNLMGSPIVDMDGTSQGSCFVFGSISSLLNAKPQGAWFDTTNSVFHYGPALSDVNNNFGLPALSGTSATTGFLGLPNVAGVPNGTPSALNGASVCYDTTNKKIWVWNPITAQWEGFGPGATGAGPATLSTTILTASNPTWSIPAGAALLEVTVVAGGGGGGGSAGSSPSQIGAAGAGGGAGQVVTSIMSVGTATALNVTVGAIGAGGAAGTINQGSAGGNGTGGGTSSVANASTGKTLTAIGGGGGKGGATATSTGGNGGSYAGEGSMSSAVSLTPGQGGVGGGSNSGGTLGGASFGYAGSGGGGGGGANAGVANGTGGGAGAQGVQGGTGGAGGGGGTQSGASAVANSGAGGGGAGGTATVPTTGAVGAPGGDGGSGFVIIRVVG